MFKPRGKHLAIFHIDKLAVDLGPHLHFQQFIVERSRHPCVCSKLNPTAGQNIPNNTAIENNIGHPDITLHNTCIT